MALFSGFSKKSILKAAIKQTQVARENENAKADQLFASAYQGFADIVKGDLLTGEALFNWGFALLHQAKSKGEDESVKLYLDAISRFNFCLLVTPNHLGAAIDGGVAYMDLARILQVDQNDELYDLAGEFFENAERIQRGSAAYNLACIYGLREQQEACIEALDLSKECGSLPSLEDMVNDEDLSKVHKLTWFIDFVDKLKAGPEPEVIDENAIVYDVEGNVVNNNKKKKELEFEGEDGNTYDVEGNIIIRDEESMKDDVTKKNKAVKEQTESSKQSGSEKTVAPD